MSTRARWLLVFGIAAGVTLLALAIVTRQALRLEEAERTARAENAASDVLRLALWRMDSAASPIIVREAARPYFHYRSFYPADRAYTSMLEAVRPGEVLVPSPLLAFRDRFIKLHFEVGPDGRVTSPQTPTGELRQVAEADYVRTDQITDAEIKLDDLTRILQRPAPVVVAGVPVRPDANPDARFDDAGGETLAAASKAQVTPPGDELKDGSSGLSKKETSDYADYAARENSVKLSKQQAVQANEIQQRRQGQLAEDKAVLADSTAPSSELDTLEDQTLQLGVQAMAVSPADEVAVVCEWREGPSGGPPELLLMRTVDVGGTVLTQGVWLDWSQLRAYLLSSISDLMPAADLVPVPLAPGAPEIARLASVPAVLVGVVPPTLGPSSSPTRVTLVIVWIASLGALVALGASLYASSELAERRGRFVSAVTHELRTPLTTFRLYTQMLSQGMVKSEESKREYLATLNTESERLARIVENVLDYARLGRARTNGQSTCTVESVLARIVPLLNDRVRQASMTLEVVSQLDPAIAVAADASVIERILFNLIDNACKYAASGQRIELTLANDPVGIAMTVRDFGPGVAAPDRRRVLKPFERGSDLTDPSIPGLGLGLAICAALARELGGSLTIADAKPDAKSDAMPGAMFVVKLPVAGSG